MFKMYGDYKFDPESDCYLNTKNGIKMDYYQSGDCYIIKFYKTEEEHDEYKIQGLDKEYRIPASMSVLEFENELERLTAKVDNDYGSETETLKKFDEAVKKVKEGKYDELLDEARKYRNKKGIGYTAATVTKSKLKHPEVNKVKIGCDTVSQPIFDERNKNVKTIKEAKEKYGPAPDLDLLKKNLFNTTEHDSKDKEIISQYFPPKGITKEIIEERTNRSNAAEVIFLEKRVSNLEERVSTLEDSVEDLEEWRHK